MECNSGFSRSRTMATYSGFCIVDPDFSRELNEKLRSGKLRVAALEILSRPRTRRASFLRTLPGRSIIMAYQAGSARA